MGKDLFQFIFSISSDTRVKHARNPGRNHSEATCWVCRPAAYDRLRQVLAFFQFQAWAPVIRIAFLAVIIVMSLPMYALASVVTLAWDDNNPTVDGYQVFQRTEGQAFDYTKPAWPTDGRDHSETSCTISDLEAGVQYYYVVRAYTGPYQSAPSNEVTYVAPASPPGTMVNGNHPPEQPALTSIADGEDDVPLTPLLLASDFNDPDPDDSHAWTEWRIYLTNDRQQIILDRTREKGQLMEIRVPHLVLEPFTRYSAQVRFFDDHGMPSPWSQPVTFTTSSDLNDQNRNNIPDTQEIRTSMDLNGDAIADLEQSSVVKSLFTYNEQHMIGISVELNDPSVKILAAASIDPATLVYSDEMVRYSGDKIAYGLLGYRIKVAPSEIITVKLDLSDPLPSHNIQWVCYDTVDGMSNCDVSTDVGDSGLVVHRYLVDGGDEDADGVANGVIVDLSGPREAETNDSSLTISDDAPAATGGSSNGCFIRSMD